MSKHEEGYDAEDFDEEELVDVGLEDIVDKLNAISLTISEELENTEDVSEAVSYTHLTLPTKA